MKYEKPQLANNLRAVSSSKVDSYLQQGLLSEKLILKKLPDLYLNNNTDWC